ncbi:IS66 family transposase [Desulfosarcina sp. OttesenSCG-928-B08]|nr:IS66 family transposase [Desulfosarcina sp. OttesenSCG-928-B08]
MNLDRATLSGWMIQLTEQCKPIIALMKEKLRKGQVINTDETTLQVLGEKDRKNTSKSYVWIFRGGLLDAPVILRFSRHSKYGLKPIILKSSLKPFWQKQFSMPLIKGIG